ncbi:MAG: signal peptide peptidase SppA [Planctomycetes bacterium]|nr:signal peptide peptidase SppA [Planctomycetota bacterium]
MLRFLREVFASALGVLIAGLIVLFLIIGGMPAGPLEGVPERAVLVLDPSLPYVDNPVPISVGDLVFGGGETSRVPLARVRDALRAAAQDERIVGLELTGVVAPMGWASLSALRAEIVRFAASGKPVMADFARYDEDAIYLASAAAQVYLPPLGEVEWNGSAAELEYLARALELAGIEVQVTRVGEYKSAVEPYLDQQMSAANREQIQTILQQQEDALLAAVAEGRALEDESALRAALREDGLLAPDRAAELGLVDGVRYWDEVAGELRDWTGDDGAGEDGDLAYSNISLEEYLLDPVCAPDEFLAGATVAVVYAEGDVVDGGGPGQVAANELVPQLAALREDEEVAAVVLRINSPGGSASASEFILREVELLAAEKPLIVSMGDVAASGGYWIAARANEIYADPGTITGSIGVFSMFPNIATLADRLGVDIETVETGPHAGMFSFYRPLAPETLAIFQASVDRVYEDFLTRVAAGRGLERDAVHAIAQGRVWTGRDAQTLGLVDELGGLPAAIQRAADLAGLKEGYATWHLYHEQDEWEALLDSWLREADPLAQLPVDGLTARARTVLRACSRAQNARGVWARLPFELRRK